MKKQTRQLFKALTDIGFGAEPGKKTKGVNIHFKRSVWAAEIIHRLHKEPTFGHVKLEKMIYLTEKLCGINTGSNYLRKAAGPYDSKALRSIDSQIKKQKWYKAKKTGLRYEYIPLEKAGGHAGYFNQYFGDVKNPSHGLSQ